MWYYTQPSGKLTKTLMRRIIEEKVAGGKLQVAGGKAARRLAALPPQKET